MLECMVNAKHANRQTDEAVLIPCKITGRIQVTDRVKMGGLDRRK